MPSQGSFQRLTGKEAAGRTVAHVTRVTRAALPLSGIGPIGQAASCAVPFLQRVHEVCERGISDDVRPVCDGLFCDEMRATVDRANRPILVLLLPALGRCRRCKAFDQLDSHAVRQVC
jgi:hypothetical protein